MQGKKIFEENYIRGRGGRGNGDLGDRKERNREREGNVDLGDI